jgi:hypothetical protein
MPMELALIYFRDSIHRYIPDAPIEWYEYNDDSYYLRHVFEYSSDFKAIDSCIGYYSLNTHLIAKNKHLPDWFVDKHIKEFLKGGLYMQISSLYLIIKILSHRPELIHSYSLCTKNVPVGIVNQYIEKFNLSECSGHTADFYNQLQPASWQFVDLDECNELPMEFIAKNLQRMGSFNPDNRRLTNKFILQHAAHITYHHNLLNNWKISDEFAHQLVEINQNLIIPFLTNRWLTINFYNRYLPYNINQIRSNFNANLIGIYSHWIIHELHEKIIGNYELCNKHLELLDSFSSIPLQLYIDRNIKTKLERIDRTPPISDIVRLFN